MGFILGLCLERYLLDLLIGLVLNVGLSVLEVETSAESPSEKPESARHCEVDQECPDNVRFRWCR